jgi:uncharacterized protein (DUF1501 family)
MIEFPLDWATTSRRAVLAAALAAPMAPAARLFAAPAGSSRLLVLFMRGAYDCASVLVPNASFYTEARPTLAIPRSGPAAAIPLDGDWGLNPVLGASLFPLWQKKQLAFIPFAGSVDMSRSHFATQDTVEYGQPWLPQVGVRDRRSGFMNRLAQELSGSTPLAFTKAQPLAFRGKLPVANVTPEGAAQPVDPRRTALLGRLYAGDRELGPRVNEALAAQQQVSAALANEMATSGQGAIPVQGFELAARRMGSVMRNTANLCFADVGGWDTHVGQRGSLDFRLGVLGRGLAGFADALGPAEWARTTVVVISEFGRTIRENGSRGTDHGHGTVFWVLGGNVRGGRIVGEQVRVARATLNEDRDFPVLNEVRGVFGGLFQRLYGLDAARLARIFPGSTPRDLGLV